MSIQKLLSQLCSSTAFCWNSCTAATACKILSYVWRAVTKGRWLLKKNKYWFFFPTYRLLIEVSILQAGAASLNRDRDWFSTSYCQKRKYRILILVLHKTRRASFRNLWLVTNHKATDKVQYLYYFNILVFHDCTPTLWMYVCVEITFSTFLTSALADSKDEVTPVTNSTQEQ